MLDGTPVLDLKPYVPYTDAIPAAGSGWLEWERASAADPIAAFAVGWSEVAAAQAQWIERCTGLALRERATAVLALGPEPHPYRRIRRDGDGGTLAVKDWRLRFVVAGSEVTVEAIASGYRPAQVARRDAGAALDAHREFRERWR
jgi:hypothetical protein